MFPSRDKAGLVTRGAFELSNITDGFSTPLGTPDSVASIFPFLGWSIGTELATPHAIYQGNDLIVAYKYGNDIVFVRHIADPYIPATETEVTDVQIWTDQGTSPFEGGGSIPSKTYEPYVVGILNEIFGFASDLQWSQPFLTDYWTTNDENSDFVDDRMGWSSNAWSSETYEFSSNWEFGDAWIDEWVNGSIDDNRSFDMWYSETDTISEHDIVQWDKTGNILSPNFPWKYTLVENANDGKDSPHVAFNDIEFSYSPPAGNIPINLYFSQNTTGDNQERVHGAAACLVMYKRATDTNYSRYATFAVNSATPKPVYCVDQGNAYLTGPKYENATVNGVQYTKVSFVLPWSVATKFKIIAIPNEYNADGQYNGGLALFEVV